MLLDDLNTPGFIAKIHELYKEAETGNTKKISLFNSACKFLGLFDISKDEWEEFKRKKVKISESFILQKIKERSEAKKSGNFNLADKIRQELLKEGIIIEDQKGNTIWKYK